MEVYALRFSDLPSGWQVKYWVASCQFQVENCMKAVISAIFNAKS